MRRKDDQLWKSLLEDVFDDFLRFAFPEADKIFDMVRGFEYLDKELNELTPEPNLPSQTRFVDKLAKVYRKNGKEEWLLIHIEVQSAGSKHTPFPERMFQYYYRLFDRYKKPITAIAILTGPNNHKIPNRFEYHFLGTHHIYQYNTLKISQFTDEELEKSNNPFALVVLAAKKALLEGKIPEKELLEQKLLVAKLLLSKKQFSHAKIKSVLTFLRNYIHFSHNDTNLIFDRQLEITSKNNPMGIVEYIAEERAKEARAEEKQKNYRDFVENLLKGTTFPMSKIATLAGVSVYFVKKVKSALQN